MQWGDVPWVWMGIRGLGIAAWVLLTATVIWGLLLRTRVFAPGGPARMMDSHKWLGLLGVLFLAAHMVLVLFDPTIHFSVMNILVPFTAPWMPLAIAFGIVAFYLLVPVTVVGRVRQRLGKRGAKAFKYTHLIAYAAWPLATAHYVMAGTDALAAWSIVLLGSAATVIVFLLACRGWRARGPLFNP